MKTFFGFIECFIYTRWLNLSYFARTVQGMISVTVYVNGELKNASLKPRLFGRLFYLFCY